MIDGCSYCAPMHWVEHRRRSDQGISTNAKLSRFRGMISSVVKSTDRQAWEETIALTNLYPLSLNSGNPSATLARAQMIEAANLLDLKLQEWQPKVALFITEVNSKSRRHLEWSSGFHETLGVKNVAFVPEGPIIATAEIGTNTHALFVVRPDARVGIRHDFKNDLSYALREYGVSTES